MIAGGVGQLGNNPAKLKCSPVFPAKLVLALTTNSSTRGAMRFSSIFLNTFEKLTITIREDSFQEAFTVSWVSDHCDVGGFPRVGKIAQPERGVEQLEDDVGSLCWEIL